MQALPLTTLPAARPPRERADATPIRERILFCGRGFARWPALREALAERGLDVHELAPGAALPDGARMESVRLALVADGTADDVHDACAALRAQCPALPILLLTAGSDLVGRILALENGADAWADAEGDMRGVVAQVRALLRRGTAPARPPAPRVLTAGAFVMNAGSREVAVGRERIDLSTLEFDLLWVLVKHAGQIVSRERLAGEIGYAADAVEGRAIDSLVGRLRQRLGPARARQVRTIRAVGYMLATDTLADLIDPSPAG